MALVNRHAASAADRLQPPFGGEPALVEGMAGLVQNPHQRAGKIVLVVERHAFAKVRHHLFGLLLLTRSRGDLRPRARRRDHDRDGDEDPQKSVHVTRKSAPFSFICATCGDQSVLPKPADASEKTMLALTSLPNCFSVLLAPLTQPAACGTL